jgi:hypothetical protein
MTSQNTLTLSAPPARKGDTAIVPLTCLNDLSALLALNAPGKGRINRTEGNTVTTTYKPEPSGPPQVPPPLATDADTALSFAGQCSLCRSPILKGDRYALIVPNGKAAHLPCISLAASRRRAVPVIR